MTVDATSSSSPVLDNTAQVKFEKHQQDKGKRKEKIESRANKAMLTAPSSIPFIEDIDIKKDSHTWYKLSSDETFIDALRNFDPKLVSNARNNHGAFARYTVLQGSVGKVTKFGKTKFFPPGNYSFLGAGREWKGTEELQKNGVDTKVTHQDVTLLSLTENQAAVVQIGKTQSIIGAGRYIIRQPATIEGNPIDIQKLDLEHSTEVITEGSKTEKDEETGTTYTKNVQYKRKITSGWTASAGAITFIRPEPGFAYLIQQANDYRIGSELTVARGDEKFQGFINMLQQSRTTKKFSFLTEDNQRVESSIQLTWKMEDGVKWVTKGRAYDDPFDMLEEKTEAYFRDAIISLDHKSVMKQKADGFDNMEKKVFPKLSNEADNLGAKLMSMEVRELRFPLIEKREVQLAEKEAKAREQKLQLERDLELQGLGNKQKSSEEEAKQKRDEQAVKAQAVKAKIEDERNLAKVTAENDQKLAIVAGQAKQEMARVTAENDQKLAIVAGQAQQEKARLEAKKNEESIKSETDKIKALAEVEIEKARAKAKAESLLIIQDAENQVLLKKAQAEAEAANLMGKALASNPALLELKKAELEAETNKERAKAIKEFAKNPNAILPEALSKEVMRMAKGHSPQDFMPVPVIGTVPEKK